MRWIVLPLLALTSLVAMELPTRAQTIKFGTLAPKDSPWHGIIRDMAEAWKAASGGAIDVRIYPGGVAGDDSDMVRKLRIGQLHAASLTGSGLGAIAPEIQALELPMMLRSNSELDYVRERIAPRLEAIFEARGFKVLNWAEAGWVRLFSKEPVVRPADLKPLRIFIWSGNTANVEAWKAAGFNPVPLAVTDIHTALQSGLIDAVPTTSVAALAFQWFPLAPHMTDFKWVPLNAATVISTEMWRKIPDELKPLILEAAREAGARARSVIREFDDKAVEVMVKHGLMTHPVPPEVIAEWERVGRRAYPKLVGPNIPPELAAEVERLRDEYRDSQ